MGRVPRLHVPCVLEALAVMVPDNRGALAAFCPVATCRVAAGSREHALWIRARENVVRVDRIAAAAHRLSFLGQRSLLGDVVRI